MNYNALLGFVSISIFSITLSSAIAPDALAQNKRSSDKNSLTRAQKKGFEALTGTKYPAVMDDLQNYCKKSLPPSIVKTVPVRGYYNQDCRIQLCAPRVLQQGYEFIEVYDQFTVYNSWLLANDFYRVSYADQGDSRCSAYNKYLESLDTRSRKRYSTAPEGKCIAIEQISRESRLSKYQVKRINDERIDSQFIKYSIRGEEIIDIKTKEAIGSDISLNISQDVNGIKTSFSCSNSDTNVEELVYFAKRVIPPIAITQTKETPNTDN